FRTPPPTRSPPRHRAGVRRPVIKVLRTPAGSTRLLTPVWRRCHAQISGDARRGGGDDIAIRPRPRGARWFRDGFQWCVDAFRDMISPVSAAGASGEYDGLLPLS